MSKADIDPKLRCPYCKRPIWTHNRKGLVACFIELCKQAQQLSPLLRARPLTCRQCARQTSEHTPEELESCTDRWYEDWNNEIS